MTDKDQVNKLFRQFKDKNVIVELRDNNQAKGKIIAIDNYLNIVLENDNGIETLKGGNIVYVSLNESLSPNPNTTHTYFYYHVELNNRTFSNFKNHLQ